MYVDFVFTKAFLKFCLRVILSFQLPEIFLIPVDAQTEMWQKWNIVDDGFASSIVLWGYFS